MQGSRPPPSQPVSSIDPSATDTEMEFLSEMERAQQRQDAQWRAAHTELHSPEKNRQKMIQVAPPPEQTEPTGVDEVSQ